jgi:alpha-tubulin suppressor-like RCC1 family protein
MYGQLGDGSNKNSNVRVNVRGVQGGTSIVAGGNHTCLLAGTDVWCWGQNAQGQIGDGTTSDRNLPVKVLSGAADITAGLNYSCAVMLNGKVMCWGDNDQGQLADGSKRDQTKPTLASLITGVANIDAGQNKSCGLTSTGLLRCVNSAPTGSQGLIPVSGTLSEPSLEVAVGRFGPTILALNGQGAPVLLEGGQAKKINGVTGAEDLDSGSGYACALLRNGTVMCWGANSYGQLGDNTQKNSSEPKLVSNLTGAWQLAVGKYHACVLIEPSSPSADNIQCWGLNTDGQLGNGTNQSSPTPVQVK